MNTHWKRSVVWFLLLAVIAAAPALSGDPKRIGGTGAQELLIPVGARGTALGPSAMVFATGVDAIYWNPAGLGTMDRNVETMFSSMQYIADINVVYGALGVNAGSFGNLGFSIKSINFGDIPVTTEVFPDGTGQTYSPTFLNLGITYSKQLTDRISIGVSSMLITERIQSTAATGFAFTVGVQYRNFGVEGLNLGVAVRNVGPNMQFAGNDLLHLADASGTLRGTQYYQTVAASSELPSSMEIGVGYTRRLDEKNSVLLGGTFRNNNSQDDEYALGAEYNFDNLFMLRGGYTFAPQAAKDPLGARSYIFDLTIGAGVHYDLGGLDLTFDYAWRHVKYFDSNNVITLKVGF